MCIYVRIWGWIKGNLYHISAVWTSAISAILVFTSVLGSWLIPIYSVLISNKLTSNLYTSSIFHQPICPADRLIAPPWSLLGWASNFLGNHIILLWRESLANLWKHQILSNHFQRFPSTSQVRWISPVIWRFPQMGLSRDPCYELGFSVKWAIQLLGHRNPGRSPPLASYHSWSWHSSAYLGFQARNIIPFTTNSKIWLVG